MGPKSTKNNPFFQIFIPINIVDFHWYVAVINASKRCIQVLDCTVKTSMQWSVIRPTNPTFDKTIYVIFLSYDANNLSLTIHATTGRTGKYFKIRIASHGTKV